MNTLPKDLLILIFKVCNDNNLVDSFSLLYGQDFLRIKYQSVTKYIDGELGKMFREQRYKLFKEDSVLTGSLLLKLILQDDWDFKDIDIATINPNYNIGDVLELKSEKDFRSIDQSWGFNNQTTIDNIRTLLSIKALSSNHFKTIRKGVDIALLDSDLITIRDHIEHSDYEFLMNYAYYKDRKLQLFVGNYLSVFNKESDFKISAIWKSSKRYHKYTFRGFNIKWNYIQLEYHIDSYLEHVNNVLKTQAYNFIISTIDSKYSSIINKLNGISDQTTVMRYAKMFMLTELMKQMSDTDNSLIRHRHSLLFQLAMMS